MPRKTDGIEFEIHPRPTKGEDGKPLLYVRPAKGRKKTVADMEQFCTKYRGLSKGEFIRVFETALELTAMWLQDGYRVETPFGSFAPKLKLMGEHTDPQTIRGKDVRYAGVDFKPCRRLIKEADNGREGFRKGDGPVGNSQMYDQQAMDVALRKSMGNGFATIPVFMIFSGLKRDSARRYLDSLCRGDNPRLRKVRYGRQWHYFPVRNT